MRLSAIDGDPDEALVLLRVAINMSEGRAAIPTLGGGITGSSGLRTLGPQIAMLAREGLLPDDHVRRAMRIIDERTMLITLPRIIEGEYISTVDSLDHHFGPGLIGGGWFVRNGPDAWMHDPLISMDKRFEYIINSAPKVHWSDNLRSFLLPTRRRMLEDARRLCEFDSLEATIAPWARPRDPFRRYRAARGSVYLLYESADDTDPDAYHKSIDLAETLMDGTRLALAVELFRRAHGEPPRTLDELVPEFIEVRPKDGFTSDGSFVYRRLDPGEDPEGRLFRLYSVGMNFTDDGGVMDLDQDPPLDDVLFDTVRPAAKPRE